MVDLLERRRHLQDLDDYYTGDCALPSVSSKAVRQAYQRLMQMSRMNYAELVVEAVRERMQVNGFRTGADKDVTGDAEAWRIWQANSLDADVALVHRNSLAMGWGYVIVGGVDPEIGAPLITPEDPREVITVTDPARRRKVVAALKLFVDDVEGAHVAYLYLPGEVHRAAHPLSTDPRQDNLTASFERWNWLGEPEQLPAPVVPVVPFPNRWHSGRAWAEFEPHLSVLDRINFTILQRLEIATMQAFRQRAIKGVPETDENGNPVDYADVFSADPQAMWLLPETAEIWESQQVDLTPIRAAVRDDVQDLAAVTRTPMYYLMPDSQNGSAEGASLAREGLVYKTEDRIVQAGEEWEQVMSLAFLFAGDEQRASRGNLETLWASPERHSLAERYDAATKASSIGMPFREVATTILGLTPQHVDRIEAERASEVLFAEGAQAAQPTGGDEGPSELEQTRLAADTLGLLRRAGVTAESAAAQVGLPGLQFIPGDPVTIRPDETGAFEPFAAPAPADVEDEG
jgi:hypothetical protein